jgi:hypothetical protein
MSSWIFFITTILTLETCLSYNYKFLAFRIIFRIKQKDETNAYTKH